MSGDWHSLFKSEVAKNTELQEQLSSALSREKALREALEWIAVHSNHYPVICGCKEINKIARQALSDQPVEPKEVSVEELASALKKVGIFGFSTTAGNVADHLLSHFDIRRKE